MPIKKPQGIKQPADQATTERKFAGQLEDSNTIQTLKTFDNLYDKAQKLLDTIEERRKREELIKAAKKRAEGGGGGGERIG